MTPGFRQKLAEVQLALMVLSRLPAGQLPNPPPRIGASAWAFPVVGLLFGGMAAVVLLAFLMAGLPAQLAAGMALAALLLTTGALHEDGLADLADGFWGGQTPERRLEIMRDSRIGSYGVIALVLGLGLRWQALALIAEHNPTTASLCLVGLSASSRFAPVLLLSWLAPARVEGMGQSASGVTPRQAGMAALFSVLALAAAGLPALPVFFGQVVASLLLGQLARKRIGGQTGDVLGASQQGAEILGWLALSLLLPQP